MYQRILVPIDGSTTSSCGLDEAIKLAKMTGGRLHLVHVVEELIVATGYEGEAIYTGDIIDAMVKTGKRIIERARVKAEAAGVNTDTEILERLSVRAADAVTESARNWQADLIVIGTHGRSGVKRLLMGSDAEQIVRQSSVPVLLVREPDPVKPAH